MAKALQKFEGISRELIALRIASELQDGTYVNLGIGIPTLVSNWIEGRDLVLQSEIGMLNTGPLALEGEIDQLADAREGAVAAVDAAKPCRHVDETEQHKQNQLPRLELGERA